MELDFSGNFAALPDALSPVSIIKELLGFLTIFDDAFSRNGGDLHKALISFKGTLINADKSEVYAHHRLADQLKSLLEETRQERNPKGLQEALTKHGNIIMGDLSAIEGNGLSIAGRVFWGSIIYPQLGWHAYLCLKGPDTSLAPAVAPTIERSISIFLNQLFQGSANHRQVREKALDRLARSAPGMAVYHYALIHPEFYGTSEYNYISGGAGAAVVAALIGRREFAKWQNRHAVKKTIESLMDIDDESRVDPEALRQRLQLSKRSFEDMRAFIKSLKSKYRAGKAEAATITDITSELSQLIAIMQKIIGEQDVDDDNPERLDKWSAVLLGVVIVAMAIGPTFRNPVNLYGNATWAAYYLYRLIDSAENPGHGLDDTLGVLSEGGTTVVFSFPTVYIPLLVKGPKAFNDPKLRKAMIKLNSDLNCAFGHRVGPLFKPVMKPVAVALAKLLRAIARKLKGAKGGIAQCFACFAEEDDEDNAQNPNHIELQVGGTGAPPPNVGAAAADDAWIQAAEWEAEWEDDKLDDEVLDLFDRDPDPEAQIGDETEDTEAVEETRRRIRSIMIEVFRNPTVDNFYRHIVTVM